MGQVQKMQKSLGLKFPICYSKALNRETEANRTENLDDASQDPKVINFIEAAAKAYNGFCFAPSQNIEGLIAPVSLINHLKTISSKRNFEKMDPFNFPDYWASTGMTKYIKNFLAANQDPYKLPNLIKNTQNEEFDLASLSGHQDLRFVSLNTLLFCTGYFSIKSTDEYGKVKLDWTNDETRRGFYQNYLQEWGMDESFFETFLSQSILINESSVEQEKKLLHIFIHENMETHFKKMLSQKYDLGSETDHEHNHLHNLFMNTLDSMLVEYDRWLRWKLINENLIGKTTGKENLRRGGEPDFIIATRKQPKQIIIFEMFKKGQAKT